MSSDAFNLTVTNLFIGLCRGDALLAPASMELSNSLEYRLAAVERRLTVSSIPRDVTPECVASSDRAGHTLLTEWTTGQASSRKRQQLRAYAAASSSDVMSSLGVPPPACNAIGTWLVVPPERSQEYSAYVSNAGLHEVLVSEFTDDVPPFRLAYVSGGLADGELESLLGAEWSFDRLPRGYIRLDTDDFDPSEFVKHTGHQIVVLAQTRQLTFDTARIGRALFPGTWDLIGTEKRTGLENEINRSLSYLAQKLGADFLVRVQGNEFQLQPRDGSRFTAWLGHLRTRVNKAIEDSRAANSQLPVI